MNLSCRIAAVAGLSCAFVAPAVAAAEAESSGVGWYVGTGFGPGFGAKYTLNGKSITFDDRLKGATDKTPLIALNIVNAGVTLGRNWLIGFSASAAAQSGTIAGSNVHLQINNYFAAVTWFPVEQGFFVRGGGGPSNIVAYTSTGNERVSGLGFLLGAGYAFQIGSRHNITFTVDQSRQSYSGSSTRPDSSQFSAVYLGYMYRR